ncbi:MAG: CoA-binding protein [Proteobacteria bacterium]|nr:CoA-binding protein [Pseudomonadota bacterium]
MKDIRAILERSSRVVVLGASSKTYKAGFYVGEYLHDQGYAVSGVNPELVGSQLFGRPVASSLDEVEGDVDLLDVFRRPELLPDHLEEMIRLAPSVVWFQQGIRNDVVARALSDAGIDVVQNRCTLADHRAFGLPRR